MTEPESVFGQLKNNRGFRRFWRCGMEKVTLEVGWLSLAHNLLKQATNDQKRRAASSINGRIAALLTFCSIKNEESCLPP
jgi:hypothetical protein